MVRYMRKLKEVPGFSDIPVAGHDTLKAVDKILIDPVTGSRNLMLLWAQLETGTRAGRHTHTVEQAYYVLSGAVKLRINGEEYMAEANSAVLIPAGVEHEVIPVSKEPPTLLIICSPPLEGFAKRPH